MGGMRTPGQRAGLDRSRVLGAARRLLAERGLTGLTMRALAASLGVAPNSVYSHVTSKDALIDELLDAALAEVAPPGEDDLPFDGLFGVMTSTFEVLLAQRDLVPLYLARQGSRGPNARALGAAMTTLLATAGVPAADRQPAIRVLIVYTVGFAAFATGLPAAEMTVTPVPAGDLVDNFGDGLRWLLQGIVNSTQ